MVSATDPAPVTVIIPAFRAEKTIRRALESVVAQSRPPREVIIVDDGSDDATIATAESCREAMGAIALVVTCQPSAGAGAARNRGVVAATQPVLAFLDADDDWLPDHLRESLEHMDKSGCTLTAHNEWLVDDGNERLNDSLSRMKERSDPFVSIYRKGCISTSTVVVSRDAVFAAGGFDPSLLNGQDVDLWLAILSTPTSSLFAFEAPLSRYFISPEGINAKTARRLKFFLKIARRWAPHTYRRLGGGLSALWFRMAAIHLEAVRSFLRSGDYVPAFITCLRFPISLLLITVHGVVPQEAADRDFLSGVDSRQDA